MAGYTRVDTGNNIADGNVISAADLDNEFDGIQAAFNASTGHNHDGTTGEGAPILVLGPTQDVVVGASTVTPKTTNTVDIGSSSLKFKDLYMAGNASIGGTLSGANASLSGTLAVTGVATLTAQPILSSLTASRAVFTDGSKGLVSNAITGTGNVVMSASPTLTGTITAEALTTSSTVTLNGGTANGVAYLNGSKVLTTGSALTFDGSTLGTTGTLVDVNGVSTYPTLRFRASAITSTLFTTGRDATGSFFTNSGTSPFYWSINGSEGMRLTSTGLGIGTSSPGTKLDVAGAGTFKVDGSGSTTPLILRNNNTASTQVVKLAFDSNGAIKASINAAVYNNDYMTFNVGSDTERMRLDSSGNLGLGVTPSAWQTGTMLGFQVGSGAAFAGDVGAGYRARIFGNAYYSASGYKYLNSSAAVMQVANGNNGSFEWHVAPSGTAGAAISFTQAMTLDASGFLGVGETSPTSRIHANGTIQARTGATGVQIYGDGGSGYVNSVGANPLILQVNSTERARIDSSGNLGLGVTPSAWASGYRALQVGLYSGLAYEGGKTFVTTNTYNNGTNWIYANSDFASRYQQQGGSHYFYTAPSGTAGNAISFSQVMTLDASGNLMVGTTTPTERLTVNGRIQSQWNNFVNGGATSYCGDATSLVTGASAGMWAARSDSALLFSISSTERARIDSSGNLLVGTTSSIGGSRFNVQHPTDCIGLNLGPSASGSRYFLFFQYNSSTVGSVTSSGSSVAYNTTSDYRLKENIQPMTGALAKVAALKPVTYTWKADGSAGEGFIAHELAEVCPAAVTGEKDAVDADGKPQYQGIDVSFLVGTLTAAIQEQQAIIEDMKTRLAAAGI